MQIKVIYNTRWSWTFWDSEMYGDGRPGGKLGKMQENAVQDGHWASSCGGYLRRPCWVTRRKVVSVECTKREHGNCQDGGSIRRYCLTTQRISCCEVNKTCTLPSQFLTIPYTRSEKKLDGRVHSIIKRLFPNWPWLMLVYPFLSWCEPREVEDKVDPNAMFELKGPDARLEINKGASPLSRWLSI